MSTLFRFYGWYLRTRATARSAADRSREVGRLEKEKARA
jgi:hypothetical protein